MKKINRNWLIAGISIVVVYIALLIVGTFYDLQISHALVQMESGNYYSTSFFGRLFETIGETPICLTCAFAGVIIFHNMHRRQKNVITIGLKILGLLVAFGMLTYMVYKLFKYTSQHFDFEHKLGTAVDFIAYVVLGGCFAGALAYFTRKLPSAFLNKMLVWAFIVLFTALTTHLVTSLLKSLACRPRYRAMFMLSDFSYYRKWFEFGSMPEITDDMVMLYGAKSDWFKSFPSGHSSSCAIVVALTGIPALFTKTNNAKYKALFAVIAGLIAGLIMFSRIIVGAHFLTDVITGAFITCVVYAVFTLVFKAVANKLNIKPLEERSKPQLIEVPIE